MLPYKAAASEGPAFFFSFFLLLKILSELGRYFGQCSNSIERRRFTTAVARIIRFLALSLGAVLLAQDPCNTHGGRHRNRLVRLRRRLERRRVRVVQIRGRAVVVPQLAQRRPAAELRLPLRRAERGRGRRRPAQRRAAAFRRNGRDEREENVHPGRRLLLLLERVLQVQRRHTFHQTSDMSSCEIFSDSHTPSTCNDADFPHKSAGRYVHVGLISFWFTDVDCDSCVPSGFSEDDRRQRGNSVRLICLGFSELVFNDDELRNKPAHAVPLASARQRPENQKRETKPAIRRSARWWARGGAHPGFTARGLSEGPGRVKAGGQARPPGETPTSYTHRG